MADETKDNQKPTGDKSGEGTSPKSGGEEKKFTQDEVNAMIARDRRKLEVENAEKTTALEQAESKLKESTDKLNTLKDVSATAEQKEAALKEGLAGMLELIPEDKRKLVSDKLSAEDQITYINENKAHLFDAGEPEVRKPSTPDSDRGQETVKASDLPGGHSSWDSFAKNDPEGYKKHRREQGVHLR